MKFDLDIAWKDTARLFGDNFSLLAVLAGVFYFLPNAVFTLAIPDLSEMSSIPADANPEAIQTIFIDLFINYWWALLLTVIIQGIGAIAMLALLGNKARHTVGDAISVGAKSFPTYIAVNLVQGFVIGFGFAVLVTIGALTRLGFVVFLLSMIGVVAATYVMTKFSMTAPIIANEGTLNPFRALSNSWRLTKGNSFRIFGFFLLILVVAIVVSIFLSMIVGLLFSLGDGDTMAFGQTILSSLLSGLGAMVFASLSTAMYLQLRRLNHQRTDASFDI